jgi:hypothetical protein
MAVLVAVSDKTIKEKHSAWREIITDYPDMPIHGNDCFDAKESLRDYLRELIAWDEKIIAEFYKPNGAVYRPYIYRERYVDSDIQYKDNDKGSFSTVEKAWEEINDWKENYSDASRAAINKEYIDDGRYIHARVNAAGEILSIYTNIPEFSESRPNSLSYIFINIPIPFQQGDLVERDGKPFVLTYLPHWRTEKPGITYEELVSGKKGDGSDMHANVHYLGARGVFYYDHVPFYGLKLWHGELKGKERFLRHLSGFIKKYNNINEHDLTSLISAYCKFTADAESAYINRYDDIKDLEKMEEIK